MSISCAAWAPNGGFLAVTGQQMDLPLNDRNVVIFLTAYGIVGKKKWFLNDYFSFFRSWDFWKFKELVWQVVHGIPLVFEWLYQLTVIYISQIFDLITLFVKKSISIFIIILVGLLWSNSCLCLWNGSWRISSRFLWYSTRGILFKTG